MYGPGADALDHSEHGKQRLVIHGHDGGVGEDAIVVLAGEVMEVGSLAARDTDLAELVRVEGEDSVGNNASLAAAEGQEAGVDGGGGLEGELLVKDAAGKGMEWGVEALEEGRLVGVDDAGKVGVGGAEVT